MTQDERRCEQLCDHYIRKQNFDAAHKVIVQAIGRNPVAPPHWAIRACADIADQETISRADGRSRLDDGKMLDEIVRYYRDTQEAVASAASIEKYELPPLSQAIRHARERIEELYPTGPGDPDDDPIPKTERRIRRAWNFEIRDALDKGGRIDHSTILKGLPDTPRIVRMAERQYLEQSGLACIGEHEARYYLHLLYNKLGYRKYDLDGREIAADETIEELVYWMNNRTPAGHG